MGLSYRRPLVAEAEIFAALHVQCWRESYAGIIPVELMATFSVEKRLPMWETALATPDRFVMGAFSDSVPAGFVISGPSEEALVATQDGHLWAIYIAQAHHRQGIGRHLVRAAAQDWLSRGGRSMTIGVLADNLPARKFYEALGARLIKHGVYNWGGHELPDCIYIMEDLGTLVP